jgi:hypothetical protein
MDRKIGFSLLAIMIVLLVLSAPSVYVSVGAVGGMAMSIVATNLGPVHVGEGTTLLALIKNSYPVSTTSADRDLMLNSFVVNGVSVLMRVNGINWDTLSFSPPPQDGCSAQDCAAHWPMTVKCSGSAPWQTPCETLGKPAILPGESAYIFYFEWWHGYPPSEPNGKFVFQFTVSGTLNGNSLTLTASSPAITMTDALVTITSNPTGSGYVLVDGVAVGTPKAFTWVVGSAHNITAVKAVSCGAGCQYVFSSWSDDGTRSHIITTPENSTTTYEATFQKQYMLTINVKPTGAGTVNATTGWYNAGQKITLTATPSGSNEFKSWTGTGTGSYTGTNNPTTITMNSAITETANFS